MKSRIMYIELKKDGVRGPGRIGHVRMSKTGRTLFYAGRELAPFKGGFKANYRDLRTLEEFWISGPRRDGNDSLYPTTVQVDEDAHTEYWRDVRGLSPRTAGSSYRSPGKSRRERDAQEKAARRRRMDRRWLESRFYQDVQPAPDPLLDGGDET